MIITVAVSKGGVGKTTLVRSLTSVACNRGYEVFIIDADSKQNAARWVTMLTALENKPENLSLASILDDAEQLATVALAQEEAGKLVIIDTEGNVNDDASAAMSVSDVVVVPLHLSFDDVTAAVQLANSHVPVIEKRRGYALPVLHVFTNNTIIDMRAKALGEVREIIAEGGRPIAASAQPQRIAYKDMQTGSTLYKGGKQDQKAIEESEAIFDEIVQLVSQQAEIANAAE